MAARTALITGGEGDLALALRACLEAAGWTVIAPGRSALDVTSTESVSAFFAGLSRLDLLVNNAGLIHDKPVAMMSASAWDEVIAVNLDGAFRCSRAALKLMSRQRSGHIINIGSFAALNGTEGQANYAAAKAGLIAFTQSVAREYGARNVRCNCVLPGFLETKMTKAVLDRHREVVIGSHSLGRLNTTTEAARFIAQLDGFENISGQVFQLDSRIGRHL
jgi:3-oxoacyl-[acyl-carrier protein] reductase